MGDVAGWKVRGPVRTLRKEHAEWDPSREVWGAPRGVSIVTFRSDGQTSESESHNADGSVFRSVYAYDEAGRVIEEQSGTDRGPTRRLVHSYDALGRPTQSVKVAPDGTRRQIDTWQYDSAGRKSKVTFLTVDQPDIPVPIFCYGVEGTEIAYGAPGAATLTIAYDEHGRSSEGSFHDANGGLVRRIVFTRDEEGRLLTEVVYFGGETPFPGLVTHNESVPVEERANLAELLTMVFADQVFSSTTYAYDEKGRLMERTIRMGNLSEGRTTYRYDDNDNVIAEISEDQHREMHVDTDGVLRAGEDAHLGQQNRFDYLYDAHGNWTERVVWSRTGSQPEFRRSNIERRAITYYHV
jgi:hypothetical protein